jgi:hypothetical protein
MRRLYMASIVVTAALVFFGAVAAVGFVTGLGVRDAEEAELPSPADVLKSLIPEAPIDSVEPVAAGVSDLKFDPHETQSSAALRFGILELLPVELMRWAAGESAALRATLEADAAAAAVKPPLPPFVNVPNGGHSQDTLIAPDRTIQAR